MTVNLYFDIYIVDDENPDCYKKNIDVSSLNINRFKADLKIRNSCSAFKLRSKYEITKYTLATYSHLNFNEVVIKLSLIHI